MRRLALLAAASALALTACGGGADADEVLSETAANLPKIRSGTLDFRLLVEPRGGESEDPFGFEVRGPFAFGKPGELPVLRVAYTQIANGQRATATIISTGENAYVQTEGRTYELGADQEEELRSAGAQARAAGTAAEIAIESWIEDAEAEDGGEVGGAETDRVSADLDVVNVVNDLLTLSGAFGQDLSQLEGADAERLADSVRSSSFELWSGKEDRLLRRLDLEIDFGLDVPRALREALGRLVGAKLTFRVAIDEPNSPVRVAEPKNALPASELPSG